MNNKLFLIMILLGGFICASDGVLTGLKEKNVQFAVDKSHIKKVDPKKIKIAAANIKSVRKWHSRINFSIKAAAPIIIVGYICYTIKRWNDSDESKRVTGGANSEVVVKEVAPVEGWGKWISNMPLHVFKVLTSSETWFGVVKVLGQAVAAGITQKAMADTAQAVDHAHTINWFVTNRAPYEVKIKSMLEHAQSLENKEYVGEEIVASQQAIVILANALVADVQNISAFIITKIADMPKKSQSDADEIKNRIIATTNKFVADLEEQCVFIAQGLPLSLSNIIKKYKKQLVKEINLFTYLDPEKDYVDEIDLEKMRIIS